MPGPVLRRAKLAYIWVTPNNREVCLQGTLDGVPAQVCVDKAALDALPNVAAKRLFILQAVLGMEAALQDSRYTDVLGEFDV